MADNYKGFDLFSGIGGFREGINKYFKQTQNKITWVGRSEIDKYAETVYQNVFKTENELNISDITDITGDLNPKIKNSTKTINFISNKLPDFDLLTAGFPCQAFSSMGDKKGFSDERGTLFYAIALILSAKNPNYFILENVRNILTIDKRKTINTIKNILNSLGYKIAIWSLNAENYGVPQTRRRVFIVGTKLKNSKLNDKDIPQQLTNKNYQTVFHLLEKNVDKKYYLSEKIKKTILSNGTGGYNYKSDYNKLIARPLTHTMHKMHRASQDNYYSDSFINGEFSEKLGIVTLNKNGHKKIRRITPKEALRIQGFNNTYINKALSSGVSDTRLYMLAGNSVPVPMVQEVTRKLFGLENAE